MTTNSKKDDFFSREKPSALKTAFQFGAAFLAGLTGEGLNYGYQQGGYTFEYAKAYAGSKRKPQL